MKDDQYLRVLNGDISFHSDHYTYLKILRENVNKEQSKPKTIRFQMNQLRLQIDSEIQKSRLKHQYNLSLASQDENFELPSVKSEANQFLLYKLRKRNQSERSRASRPISSSQRVPNKIIDNSMRIIQKTKDQNHNLYFLQLISDSKLYKNYLNLHKVIKKKLEEGLDSKSHMLTLFEQKIQMANEMVQVNATAQPKVLEMIRNLKYKLGILQSINRMMDDCDTIHQKQTPLNAKMKLDHHQFQQNQRTYTQFLDFLKCVEVMDDRLFEFMLDYKVRNQVNEENETLEDIHQMREEAYNLKVKNFSKYHDIDNEKKRELSKLRRKKN